MEEPGWSGTSVFSAILFISETDGKRSRKCGGRLVKLVAEEHKLYNHTRLTRGGILLIVGIVIADGCTKHFTGPKRIGSLFLQTALE